MYIPEPSLTPPEHPEPPLYCQACHRPIPEMFELSCSEVICRSCLAEKLADSVVTMDELSALLCAPVVSQP